MKGYEVKVKECTRELTARERIMLKDTTDAVKLDEATEAQEVIIECDFCATLSIHNEKADDKDYETFILVAKDGTRYYTGSESFITTYLDIAEEMGDEPFAIKAYKMPSKNFKGKSFLTCSIV